MPAASTQFHAGSCICTPHNVLHPLQVTHQSTWPMPSKSDTIQTASDAMLACLHLHTSQSSAPLGQMRHQSAGPLPIKSATARQHLMPSRQHSMPCWLVCVCTALSELYFLQEKHQSAWPKLMESAPSHIRTTLSTARAKLTPRTVPATVTLSLCTTEGRMNWRIERTMPKRTPTLSSSMPSFGFRLEHAPLTPLMHQPHPFPVPAAGCIYKKSNLIQCVLCTRYIAVDGVDLVIRPVVTGKCVCLVQSASHTHFTYASRKACCTCWLTST